MLTNLLRRMFGEQETPRDLAEFNEARERLHATSNRLSREADEFGAMIRRMRREARAEKAKGAAVGMGRTKKKSTRTKK